MLKNRLIARIKKIRKQLKPKYITVIAAVIIIIAIISATAVFISSKDEEEFDPKVDAWYKVADWEVEVCSKWGGAAEPQSFSGSGITASSVITTSETVSAQGKKTTYNIKGNKTYMYEASWYYQPQTGSASYIVYLMKGSNTKDKIYEGSSTAQTGDGNYHAVVYATDPGYTSVIIEYGSSGSLIAPIQKKEVTTG